MRNLTVKHFRYFDALARLGHFGRAAEACSISQPALSVKIKELETMLGAPLVERTARRIRLTALGEEFLERARKILTDVDEMSGLARVANGPMTGKLRLGIIPTVAPYLLPSILKALSDQLPGLDLMPRESVTRSLVEDLLQSRLDVIIAALPVSEPTLRELALFDEEFVLVRAQTEGALPMPRLDNLPEMKLLLLEEGHCLRDQALSFCNTNSEPNLVMEGSSLSTLVQMVNSGLGWTLIPEIAISLEARQADLCFSRFRNNPPKRTIGMVWRKTNPLEPQLMDIAAVVKEVAQAKLTSVPE